MIDFLATERQYMDHLLPIWESLPAEVRGHAYVPGQMYERYSMNRGSQPSIRGLPRGMGNPILVASFSDLRAATHRRVIFVEHGSGQDYGDRNSSNPGGADRDNVDLFLCTNASVAHRNKNAYPASKCVVVGSPKMDQWYTHKVKEHNRPIIAVSFHWNNHQVPESRWAYPHYRSVLQELAKHYTVFGHSHPRIWRKMVPIYETAGIQPVREFRDILFHSDLYIADNSSTIFEFASTDRPVVLLNAPWYRKDINHGLRFWEAADIGLQVDQPQHLLFAVQLALSDPESVKKRRKRIIEDLYPYRDGQDTRRAVESILSYLKGVGHYGRDRAAAGN